MDFNVFAEQVGTLVLRNNIVFEFYVTQFGQSLQGPNMKPCYVRFHKLLEF